MRMPTATKSHIVPVCPTGGLGGHWAGKAGSLPDVVEGQAPGAFRCPIGRDLMSDPLVCSDGHSYERVNIERWLRISRTSPITGLRLEHTWLAPNHALRNSIEEFVDRTSSLLQPKGGEAEEHWHPISLKEVRENAMRGRTAGMKLQPITQAAAEVKAFSMAMASGNRGDFEPLVTLVSDPTSSDETTEQAAAAIWGFALEAGWEMAIARSGAILPLVLLTSKGTPVAKVHASGALANLAVVDDIKVAIAAAGGIVPLVELTRSGRGNCAEVKEYAAGALWNLAANSDNQREIAEADGIAPLVELVRRGTAGAKENAAGTLRNLALNADNKVAIVRAGGIVALVELTRSFGTAEAETQAAAALWNLAIEDNFKKSIAWAGGIPPLVELTCTGSTRAKEAAAGALKHLAANDANKLAIIEAGGIAPLVELTRSGSTGAMREAASTLRKLAVSHASRSAMQELGFRGWFF